MDLNSNPDQAIFVIDLQDANIKVCLLITFYLHHFSKTMFFLLFLHDDGRIRIQEATLITALYVIVLWREFNCVKIPQSEENKIRESLG
jgi:hypothetical protein